MNSYFKIVRLMISTSKKMLCYACIAMVALLTIETAIPIGINKLITSLEHSSNTSFFIRGILVFIFAYLIRCFLTALNTKLYIRIGSILLWNMRKKIYQSLWKGDYIKYIQKAKDNFKFVLTTQTYTAFAITVVYSVGGLTNVLTVFALLFLTFFFSIPVGIMLIIGIMCTLGISFITGKSILNCYETSNAAHEKDSSQVYETVELTEVTRTNGLEDYFLKKNKMIHNDFMKSSEKAEEKSAFFESVENSMNALIYILVAGVMLLTSQSNEGELVSILFITNLLLDVSHRAQRQLQVVIKNIPVFDDVIKLMDLPIESKKSIEKINNIDFNNVSLSIDDRDIIKELSFSIKKGENILIQGENGSGKSSVLKMILGLYKPSSGQIAINNHPIDEYDPNSFYKEICYISQDELILNESIEDYIRYITHSTIDNEQIKILRSKLKLNEDISVIEENGNTLSGGEKKKLLMMKCLSCKNASLIILDEIDAGLDYETKCILKKIEKELTDNSDITVLKISHIDNDIEDYNKVISLS